MAASGSVDRAPIPWFSRVGALLALIWLVCFVEFGLAFGSSVVDRWLMPSGFEDGEFCILGAGAVPNGIMLMWPFAGIAPDLRYLLTGAIGVIFYAALIRYVRVRTLSWRGGLIVLAYLAVMVGLMFVNVLLMFPPPPPHPA